MAGGAMIGEYIWTTLGPNANDRPLAEPIMFAVSFLSIAVLTYLLGRQIRESQALAERRGGEIADLAAVNELIIRRMRTGVLLVDGEGRSEEHTYDLQSLLRTSSAVFCMKKN